MRLFLAALATILFTTVSFADDPLSPDGTPLRLYGGLMIFRQGNQTAVSVGGAFLPRHVRVKTRTPDGVAVTRFTTPSLARDPNAPFFLDAIPASLNVEIPDDYGLLYVDGQLVETRGTVRQLESPPLARGQTFNLHLRAAFAAGDQLLIEDKQVSVWAGGRIAVKFDGSAAIAMPYPRSNTQSVRSASGSR